jgi:hypothetical protein
MQSSKQWIVHRKRVADKAKAIKETAGKKAGKSERRCPRRCRVRGGCMPRLQKIGQSEVMKATEAAFVLMRRITDITERLLAVSIKEYLS